MATPCMIDTNWIPTAYHWIRIWNQQEKIKIITNFFPAKIKTQIHCVEGAWHTNEPGRPLQILKDNIFWEGTFELLDTMQK